MNTTSLITVALLTVGLLTSCTPTTPNLPPPKPSPTCTPETGGPETPCTQHQHDQMITKDKLYTEAETVYRKFFAEEERIYRMGGITQPTPVLLETTTGEFLKASMSVYKDLRRYKATAVGGAYRLAWLKRTPGISTGGSVIALQSCTDTSSVMMGSDGEKPQPGGMTIETVYLTQDSEKLRLASFNSKATDRC